jgi:RimJ/RimL family protein N-acetyltransferase
MNIKLLPFTEADIDQLIGWVPSADFLLQWGGTGFKFPLDRAQLQDHLARAAGENPDRLIYKAVDPATGRVVGHAELLAIDRQHRSAIIGRMLVGPSELRGQGIGQQIVRELLRIAFQEMSLHRVALHVYDFNTQAIRCYEKIGFCQEGLRRDVHKMGTQYWSVYIMSILEDEWREASL